MPPSQRTIRPGPDFLIIGAMKSATSAIYSYLIQHPRVIDRQPKELHFFTKPHLYERGVNWYSEKFREKETPVETHSRLIGEASPSYLLFRDTPRRVRSVFPDVRIIACLRHPTERAISHFHHCVARVGNEPRGIEEAFGEDAIRAAVEAIRVFDDEGRRPESAAAWNTARYLLNGHYSSLLEGWYETFPAPAILLLDYHRLATEPRLLLNEVYGFLGLPEFSPPAFTRLYQNRYPSPPQSVTAALNRYYDPHNQELEARFGRRFSWLGEDVTAPAPPLVED